LKTIRIDYFCYKKRDFRHRFGGTYQTGGKGMIKTSVAAAISLFAFLLSAQTVSAASVNHCGPTICYTYDDAQAAVALFGLPTFVGDAVRFLPPSFRAQSDAGVAQNTPLASRDTVVANFRFDRVYSGTGKDIGFIRVVEAGDYEIINGDDVGVDLFVQAASNVDAFDVTTAINSFDASGDSGGLQKWQLDAIIKPLVDPSDIWGAGWLDSSDMALNIQNTLTAYTTDTGETAWIQKKITLVVSEVPVPAAVWLFGSALAGLGWMRRRA
jgi:hypothetical protein